MTVSSQTPAGGRRLAPLRITAPLSITGGRPAYILWKIDVGKTAHVLATARLGYFFAALAIMLAAVWPMAWRWQRLLKAQGISDSLGWLSRAYFVSFTAAQVLPTSLGGDASRIYQASRRHRGQGGPLAGSVLLERALGGAATLTLAAVGFALAVGRYDIGAYLWLELTFVVATVCAGVLFFSRSMRRPLARVVPTLQLMRLERPLRAAYEGIHAYRRHARLCVGAFLLTVVVQAFRILAIWLAGKAVHVDLSPRPYYVMGPMLLLVILVPFTANGLAVREAFFVSFLTQLGVGADAAFATGFLFFVVTISTSLPGVFILARETLRRGAERKVPLPGT